MHTFKWKSISYTSCQFYLSHDLISDDVTERLVGMFVLQLIVSCAPVS